MVKLNAKLTSFFYSNSAKLREYDTLKFIAEKSPKGNDETNRYDAIIADPCKYTSLNLPNDGCITYLYAKESKCKINYCYLEQRILYEISTWFDGQFEITIDECQVILSHECKNHSF